MNPEAHRLLDRMNKIAKFQPIAKPKTHDSPNYVGARTVNPPRPVTTTTSLNGTARSGTGRLRNLKAMNNDKFAGVHRAVLAEADDPEAIRAVKDEAERRGW